MSSQLLRPSEINQNSTVNINITSDGITSQLNLDDLLQTNSYNLKEEMVVWDKCINSTKKWLNHQNTFVTIFIEEPGQSSEIFGPKSDESVLALEAVDRFLGNLTNILNMRQTDLIIMSTPGFLEVSTTSDKVINLEKIGNSLGTEKPYITIGSTPVISIKPLKGNSKILTVFNDHKAILTLFGEVTFSIFIS